MITLKSASVERFTLAQPYTMARGVKSDVDVVVCEVTDGTHVGRGEGTPIYFEGETAELCVDAIEMRAKQNKPISRENLLVTMMEGAARNAFDCALWDLESKATGKPVWELAGLKAPQPMVTAYPISLDTPEGMHEAAQKAAAQGFTLLKVMLDAGDIMTRIAAVRAGAPNVRLIVDANESWEELDILSMAMGMQQYGVELIEQPVSAGFEDELMGVESPVPFCADESCHTSEDIERVEDCFGAININLDKTGGLTEALALADAAQSHGIHVMAGSMLCTSLAIAPALVLAQKANWVDLAQPALLKKDRSDGATYQGGMIQF